MNLDLFNEMLNSKKPSLIIKNNEDYFFKLIEDLKKSKGFNQNNPWHIYDLYEHTLHVLDGVDSYYLRLAALFHDLGKIYINVVDDKGISHYRGHWIKSSEIFLSFANKYNLDEKLVYITNKIIFYHDCRIEQFNKEQLVNLVNVLTHDQIKDLYKFKKSDLLAQNKIHHDLLDIYEIQEYNLLIFKDKYDSMDEKLVNYIFKNNKKITK